MKPSGWRTFSSTAPLLITLIRLPVGGNFPENLTEGIPRRMMNRNCCKFPINYPALHQLNYDGQLTIIGASSCCKSSAFVDDVGQDSVFYRLQGGSENWSASCCCCSQALISRLHKHRTDGNHPYEAMRFHFFVRRNKKRRSRASWNWTRDRSELIHLGMCALAICSWIQLDMNRFRRWRWIEKENGLKRKKKGCANVYDVLFF